MKIIVVYTQRSGRAALTDYMERTSYQIAANDQNVIKIEEWAKTTGPDGQVGWKRGKATQEEGHATGIVDA